MRLRPVTAADRPEWRRLRAALWPDCAPDEHEREMATYLAGAGAVFVLERPDGRLAGFVELTLRDHAEGCLTSPVAYVEGLYVDPDAHRQGHAHALLEAGERWGRDWRCREMASDCAIDNAASRATHRAFGFEEVERLVHFRRRLDRPAG